MYAAHKSPSWPICVPFDCIRAHGNTACGAHGGLRIHAHTETSVASQVVRRALDEGYEVRCTVRPRQNPADFLRDWGATTVQVQIF